MSRIALVFTLFLLHGCSTFTERPSDADIVHSRARLSTTEGLRPPSIRALASGAVEPPEAGDVGEQLSKAADEWFYGPGLGRTLINVGAVILFPPYALYLAGNVGLTLAGYEPLYITDAIPEEPRQDVLELYDSIASVPGRITSQAAGRTQTKAY